MTGPVRGEGRFQRTWRLAAPPGRVFDAWTDPRELTWFFNDAMPIPPGPVEVDLREGGTFRLLMIIDDKTRYDTGGVYREIVPDQKLVFAWGAVGGWPGIDLERLDESPRVEVTFRPHAEGTVLTLDVSVPAAWIAGPDGGGRLRAMEDGWRDTVDRLARRLGGLG